MPITLLAHQAPVLPLKRRWTSLDGVALVVGSAVPDLARATLDATPRMLLGQPLWWDGHTATQQLGWSLPVGLVLTWLVRRILAPRLGPYLPDLGGFHLQDVRHVGRTRHRWWVIAGSVLIGSFSHVLVDGLTHSDRGSSSWLPGLDVVVGEVWGRTVTTAHVLQAVASVTLTAVTVWEMYRIGSERLIRRWSGAENSAEYAAAPHRFAVWTGVVSVVLPAAVWAGTQWERGPSIVAFTWMWLCMGGLTVVALVLAPQPSDPPLVPAPESLPNRTG